MQRYSSQNKTESYKKKHMGYTYPWLRQKGQFTFSQHNMKALWSTIIFAATMTPAVVDNKTFQIWYWTHGNSSDAVEDGAFEGGCSGKKIVFGVFLSRQIDRNGWEDEENEVLLVKGRLDRWWVSSESKRRWRR
jgi:hypothetical protein